MQPSYRVALTPTRMPPSEPRVPLPPPPAAPQPGDSGFVPVLSRVATQKWPGKFP